MSRRRHRRGAARGFTLIEVLVALVIVAFGMGAVLAALNSSATNLAAMREKTLAQWVALNRIADVRLNLQPPQTGTTEGDVKNFANGDWHWQQIVTNLQEIPGLAQVTVKVRRTGVSSSSGSSIGSGSSHSLAKEPDWTTTVIGFRGTTLAAASGEVPDWSGASSAATTTSSSSSSSGSGSSSGSIANPGTGSSSGVGTSTSTGSSSTSLSGSSGGN
jgi:general secretion pathway protein I